MVQAWVVFPLVLGALSLGLGPAGGADRGLASAVAAAAFGRLGLGGLRRVDGWALGSVVAVFGCFGIPVLASGTPMFAGAVAIPTGWRPSASRPVDTMFSAICYDVPR